MFCKQKSCPKIVSKHIYHNLWKYFPDSTFHEEGGPHSIGFCMKRNIYGVLPWSTLAFTNLLRLHRGFRLLRLRKMSFSSRLDDTHKNILQNFNILYEYIYLWERTLFGSTSTKVYDLRHTIFLG